MIILWREERRVSPLRTIAEATGRCASVLPIHCQIPNLVFTRRVSTSIKVLKYFLRHVTKLVAVGSGCRYIIAQEHYCGWLTSLAVHRCASIHDTTDLNCRTVFFLSKTCGRATDSKPSTRNLFRLPVVCSTRHDRVRETRSMPWHENSYHPPYASPCHFARPSSPP